MERSKRITRAIQNVDIRFSAWTVPLALAGLLVITFGLLINQLGFYQDDWHHIYFGHALGLSRMWDMFLYDGRPLAAVLYIAGFSVLGFTPLHWHISTLTLRFLTVLFTWLYLKDIWPEHRRQVTWAALLFAVYPLFKLQPLSVAYTVHWSGYLLFSISIWAMVSAIRRTSWGWAFATLGWITAGLQLAFIEYYAGVELVRPLIIGYLISRQAQSRQATVRKTLKSWLPYILILIAFIIYRLYLIPSPEAGYERNVPTVLFDLFRTPLATGIQLAQDLLQDTFFILVTVWGDVFTPELFRLTQPASFKVLIIAITAGLGLVYYLRGLIFGKTNPVEDEAGWPRPALVIGLAYTILGPVPAWLTNQSVSQDNPLWSGRLGMASMVGASLVFIALLEILIKKINYRIFVLAALIVFASSWHLLYTNDYRWSWTKQTRFFQQLYWRAPYIEEDTTILSDEEIFPYMGEYPTSFALGNLYPKNDQSMALNYWFYSILRRFNYQIDDLVSGVPFEYAINFGRFEGSSLDSLVIYYLPENNQCLWVLRPEDANIRALPPVLQEAAALSSLERIRPQARGGHEMPTDIFGRPAENDWCYFFQKASLAQQYQHWDEVVSLWQAAEAGGLDSTHGVEYLPFIEGFAYSEDWQQARALSLRANRLTQGMKPALCATWERVANETPASEGRDGVIADVQDRVGCFR
jgi:hypothetical protein